MNYKDIFKRIIYMPFLLFPIKDTITVSHFYGKTPGDNPKYVVEALERSGVKIFWLVDYKYKYDFGENVIPVKKNSIKALYVLATSKVWIDSCRKQQWIVKRKKQHYVQVWHGGTWFKKAEKDAEEKLDLDYVKAAIHDSMMADAVVSCSKWNTELLRRSFWYTGYILESGSPRADIFFRESSSIKKNVFQYFKINEDVKLLLYAPTFRNGGDCSKYNLNYELLLDCVEKKWGGAWKIIIRLHPRYADNCNLITYSDRIINGSLYPDINELIVSCDLFITDYSSGMFDAMQAKKKVFLYVDDLKDFSAERGGFYFNFSELPFDLVKNNSDFDKVFEVFDETNYRNKVRNFMAKIGYYDDGLASDRVAQYILNVMHNENG